jgi:hypothetical protein
MRRALTLAVVGSFLVVASAAPAVSFSSIKALNTLDKDNKDSWSFKGTVTGVPTAFDWIKDTADNGLEMSLQAIDPGTDDPLYLDTVDFAAADCKTIRRGTGVMCKTDGTRMTATKVGI